MAKKKKNLGYTNKNGYWYASVDGRQVYCGPGDEGKHMAEAARAKYISKRYETKEVNAGLKVKRAEFRTVGDLMNWYTELPSIQKQKSYDRKVFNCRHLVGYFGKLRVNQVEGDTQERYREVRLSQGAAGGTVDVEISLLSAMYHTAYKRKKLNDIPREFVIERKTTPRRLITEDEYHKLLDAAVPEFKDILVCRI
jgi:hypothetical protein